MKKALLEGLLLTTAICFAQPASAENIFEVLSQTYNSNPTLQAERAYLRSVDENVALAKSGFRPTLSLDGAYVDGNNDVKKGVGNDGGYNSLLGSANISQPVFSGFSTVNSVKAAERTVKAEQSNLSNVEQSILLQAATAYLDVLQNQAIVDLQKNNEELLKKKLDETLERFKVGEVTRTDVSQARARHSQAIADRIASEGTLQSSIASYIKLIGSEPTKLSEPVEMKDFLPSTYDDALQAALNNSYTIKQAKHLYAARGYEVYANTGALFPVISLDGTVGRTKAEQGSIDTTTDNAEWGVNLSIPLYTGGATRSKIRQSKYLKWQAQENVLEAKRAVKSSVQSNWETMKSNESQLKALEAQIKANAIALEGVQKEEALGNRTILDVLDAYQELLTSKVNDVKARRTYYVSAMNLLATMGKLTAKDLKLDVELYDADTYYQETKDKWLSLS